MKSILKIHNTGL